MILTNSGRCINPFDLHTEDVCIEDIATSLSGQRRFSGHTGTDYSVAEHSILTMLLVLEKCYGNLSTDIEISNLCKVALMHDAPEAYFCDMPGPIKRNFPFAKELKEFEDKIWNVIATKYNLYHTIPPEVYVADKLMVVNEIGSLFSEGHYMIDTGFSTKEPRENLHQVVARFIDNPKFYISGDDSQDFSKLLKYNYNVSSNPVQSDEIGTLSMEGAKEMFLQVWDVLCTKHVELLG